MKISIITVCFNEKETIEGTFLSVFNQTYQDVELVVIDGASNDGTLQVIEKYREKIAYFVSEPDGGVYNAMNKGIKAASGDFIIFLNANDVFYDNFVLEKVAKALRENPEVKILFGDVDYISPDRKNIQTQTFENIKTDLSLILNNICHQSIFYHKSLFKQFGLYSEEFKIYADWDFNIKCLVENKGPALYLPTVISKFQLGGICSTKENRKICKNERKALIRKYYSDFKFLIFVHDFIRKYLRFFYKIFLKAAFLDKNELNIKQVK